jgi:outer membrane protein assembly factor BamB
MLPRFVAVLFLFVAHSWVHADNWPGFRGPTGQGLSSEKGLPIKWSEKEGLAWSVAIPGEGWSSPIVWGDQVFVTAAEDGGESCRVIALARADGKTLWNVEVFRQPKLHKEGRNSYATPTPVTDGRHVYAVFNDGSIAALTLSGKVAWINRDVKYYSQHGLGNSPILYQDMLIMSFDGSSPGPDKLVGWQKPWQESFLLALDKNTGKERWRGKRGLSRIAHTTPALAHADGVPQLISSAGDVIQGFDPATGRRLWSVRAEGEGVVPSPVLGDGLVFAASGFGNPRLRAVKLAKDNDEGTRRVVWELKRNVPMMPSAVFVKPNLFVVSEKGLALCLDAETGQVKWEERIGDSFMASPVYADGRIYFLAEDGQTTVIDAKDQFAVIARNKLPGPCRASMAVSEGQFFIRNGNQLFCIGKN